MKLRCKGSFCGAMGLQDFSHYTVVCEAGPGDRCLDEAVRELVPRVHHIHARIGCENSPQVRAAPHALFSAAARAAHGPAGQRSARLCLVRAYCVQVKWSVATTQAGPAAAHR